MTQGMQLPPPYMGQQDKLPVAAMESPYAEIVSNYNLDEGVAKLRKGDSITDTSATWDTPLNLSIYTGSSSILILCVPNLSTGKLEWWNCTTSTPVSLYAPATYSGDDEIHTLYFNGRMYWFGEWSLRPSSLGPVVYDGSTFGAAGYTWPTGFVPFGGAVYKNRAYFINRAATSYGYSGIDAVAGAVTSVDLGGIISQPGHLYGIRSISLSEGVQQQNVLAFVFSSGEVLFYSGSYPNASDWSIVGRFNIPKPVSYNSVIDVAGDAYVITEAGLISLRALCQNGGREAVENAISAPIANRWRQIVDVGNAEGVWGQASLVIKGVFDQARNRLIVTFPYYVLRESSDPYTAGVLTRLVYSFSSGAWFEHVAIYDGAGTGFLAPSHVFFNRDIYYGASDTVSGFIRMVEGASSFCDELNDGSTGSAQFQLRTAPLPISKFGVNKISGIEVIIKSDQYDNTNFTLVGDIGTVTTAAQTASGNGSNMSKVLVNAGIEAGYVQLDITGYPDGAGLKTVGQEIHGFNVWYEAGGLR